jgi:hypothetical protein
MFDMGDGMKVGRKLYLLGMIGERKESSSLRFVAFLD